MTGGRSLEKIAGFLSPQMLTFPNPQTQWSCHALQYVDLQKKKKNMILVAVQAKRSSDYIRLWQFQLLYKGWRCWWVKNQDHHPFWWQALLQQTRHTALLAHSNCMGLLGTWQIFEVELGASMISAEFWVGWWGTHGFQLSQNCSDSAQKMSFLVLFGTGEDADDGTKYSRVQLLRRRKLCFQWMWWICCQTCSCYIDNNVSSSTHQCPPLDWLAKDFHPNVQPQTKNDRVNDLVMRLDLRDLCMPFASRGRRDSL